MGIKRPPGFTEWRQGLTEKEESKLWYSNMDAVDKQEKEKRAKSEQKRKEKKRKGGVL